MVGTQFALYLRHELGLPNQKVRYNHYSIIEPKGLEQFKRPRAVSLMRLALYRPGTPITA